MVAAIHALVRQAIEEPMQARMASSLIFSLTGAIILGVVVPARQTARSPTYAAMFWETFGTMKVA